MLDENIKWSSFLLSDFAEIKSGQDIPTHTQIPGATPYISASANNNGVSAFVKNSNSSKSENILAVNRNGSVGEVFYHPYKALFGNDTRRIVLKTNRNKWTNLFLATAIRQQKSTYGYGYKLGTGRLLKQRIMLPLASDGGPDWEFMMKYTKSRYKTQLEQSIFHAENELAKIGLVEDPGMLQQDSLVKKLLTDVVDSLRSASTSIDGIRLNKSGQPYFPYISRKAGKNGVSKFVPKQTVEPDAGNAIVIGLDTQTVSYQASSFYCSQNIQVIRSANMSQYSAMSLISLIKPQMVKFMWGGTGATLGRLRKMEIYIPVTSDGNTDWDYLEQLGKWRRVVLLNRIITNIEQELDRLD